MRALATLSYVACAAVGALAPAAASAQPQAVEAAIIEGAPSSHRAVAALLDASDAVYCSGTLIAPDAVLTAAHCVDEETPRLAHFAGAEGAPVLVRAWQSHPDYDPRALSADLAILWLDEPVAHITPQPLLETSMDETWVGRAVRVVGHGLTSSEELSSDGAQRERLTTIERVEPERVRHGPSSCDGDSGGAVLDEADGTLVAVISSGPRGCAFYGRATRIDAHRAWLVGALARGAPEPMSCAMRPARHRTSSLWCASALAITAALARRKEARGRRARQ